MTDEYLRVLSKDGKKVLPNMQVLNTLPHVLIDNMQANLFHPFQDMQWAIVLPSRIMICQQQHRLLNKRLCILEKVKRYLGVNET